MESSRAEWAPEHVVELRIPSQLGWEWIAMDLAATVARRMGFPLDRVEDIKTAVSEATVNAIEHGNGLDASRTVQVVLTPEVERLAIDVRDGAARPLRNAGSIGRRPNLKKLLSGRADTRGWGTFLIKSLVDEVEFSSTGQGNQVRMVIHLRP